MSFEKYLQDRGQQGKGWGDEKKAKKEAGWGFATE